MTEATMFWLVVVLFAALLAVSIAAVTLYRKLQATRRTLTETAQRHDNVVNLLGAAALVKGGTLTIPCREPNFNVPGLNIERKGNAYKVTVSGGPHL